ncbi:phosphate ABC transporter permease PstA [Acaryochloris marina]|uniref:Phosphate transport system permease protein PstA n=1 Tax=Acaryochloris marina (strain MBIC 11017) TaxID=329726 RepID=B0C181_ACAM1|nr:phosphate ABC transporter permease PstA [Acaryochloris marina]ABW28479.1 phosphate ABC transporter, permease protein PstA [Acaryochloris marina MBIC11017]
MVRRLAIPIGKEQGATLVVWLVALGITAVFLWLLSNVIWQGGQAVNGTFLTQAPAKAGLEGGIAPILVSTGLVLGVCMGVSLPLGLGTAVFLSEFNPQRSHRVIRLSLDILAGVPSIVFGLFGNAFFSKVLDLGFSILSGGLTLACMVLPILIRSIQVGLVNVPREYRQAAAALGLSRLGTLKTLILPAALPGIAVGVLLGIGRAIAETAALIFTSGYVDRMPTSLLDSGRVLSIHIFDLAMNIPGGEQNAYGTALVLVILLILINTLVSWLAERFRQSKLQIL